VRDDPSPLRAVRETVLRAQQGDQAAFRELYEANVGRIHAVCLRLAGDQREAEEHTQDVFVRAWQRLATFRGESAFSTWLHRLAVNEVLQARRSAARRSARITLGDDAESVDAVSARGDPPSPDLEQAIARLPEGARTVFVLHDIEGYQHEEIARMSGIAEGTSKAQLHRARRLLREALER
jgi:RNA polymerase sigma-70 factor (ECF subfamily)